MFNLFIAVKRRITENKRVYVFELVLAFSPNDKLSTRIHHKLNLIEYILLKLLEEKKGIYRLVPTYNSLLLDHIKLDLYPLSPCFNYHPLIKRSSLASEKMLKVKHDTCRPPDFKKAYNN
jgi:hypothetical protein